MVENERGPKFLGGRRDRLVNLAGCHLTNDGHKTMGMICVRVFRRTAAELEVAVEIDGSGGRRIAEDDQFGLKNDFNKKNG